MNDNMLTNNNFPVVRGGDDPRGRMTYETMIEPVLNLKYYWNLIKKRKWQYIGFVLASLLVAGIITAMTTPMFRASSIIQITQDKSPSITGIREDPFGVEGYTDDKFYETQYFLLKSQPIAERISESLNIGISPGEVMDNLVISPIKRTFLVEVGFISPDRYISQKIPNAICDEFIKFTMDTRLRSFDLVKKWLEKELSVLATRVQESEKKVYDYAREKDFLSVDRVEENLASRDKEGGTSGNPQEIAVNKYFELDSLLTKAQAERAAKEAQYRQVAEKGANATIFANNTLLMGLRQGVIDQEAKVAGMNKIYDENYPTLKVEKTKLQEMRSRLNNEVQNAAAGIKSDYEIATRVEKMLEESFKEQKQKVQNLQANLVKHNILKRDLKSNEQLYHGLLTRMKEASISSTVIPTNIVRITNAELPMAPFKPNKVRNMLLGLAIGLIGGIILIRLIEYFDDTIKDSLEVERICKLPILGTVPQIRDKGKMADRSVTICEPETSKYLIDPIRNLRTSIMLSSPGKAPAVITVTSPYPGEGKSTVSLNLGMALSMHNHKCVIIEADLRKPSLSKYFNAQGNPGLSTYLSGNAHLSSVVLSTDIPNLSLICSGPVPPNPTELLGSKLFKELLEKLKNDFKHIIIDTPPIIGLADGRVVSTLSDAVILVIRHNKTSRDGVLIANQLLERDSARIIGYVLNQFIPQHGDRGYYYYYKNYYSKYTHENK